jgi:hypothetical protein
MVRPESSSEGLHVRYDLRSLYEAFCESEVEKRREWVDFPQDQTDFIPRGSNMIMCLSL